MLRACIVGMRGSNSYGHTTTAMHEYRVHPPPRAVAEKGMNSGVRPWVCVNFGCYAVFLMWVSRKFTHTPGVIFFVENSPNQRGPGDAPQRK